LYEVSNCWLSSQKLVAVIQRIVYGDSHIESGDSHMPTKPKDWRTAVKGILKAELKRRNLSYADLANRLRAIGITDNERNISNKIARGSFTAVFFVQCLRAIDCHTIDIEHT
jgi:hypothetical protein